MTEDSTPPVMPDANGYYPVPIPGQWVEVNGPLPRVFFRPAVNHYLQTKGQN